MEQKLADTKGLFKGKERKQLQEQMGQLQTQIENMKRYLPTIVQGYGYKNVKEFLAEYKASKGKIIVGSGVGNCSAFYHRLKI